MLFGQCIRRLLVAKPAFILCSRMRRRVFFLQVQRMRVVHALWIVHSAPPSDQTSLYVV